MFEQSLKNEFLVEASELLENAEQFFLALEKDPHNGSIIKKLCRLFYTLKGSSLAAGFKQLADFTDG